MQDQPGWFEQLVAEDWSRAVIEATDRFDEVREQVIGALNSADPQMRSAAIATLIEADDATAHDLVVALANDRDANVRSEVFEYLGEFPTEADVPLLLGSLRSRNHLFLASSALAKLCGTSGPLLDDEESEHDAASSIAEWERLVRARGFGDAYPVH
jgi:HEAT repeat protein